jgi:hypothetical protein
MPFRLMNIFVAALLAPAFSAGASPIPAKVSSHVSHGHFDPGDFGWARGAFPGASAAESAEWKVISEYGDHCADAAPEDPRAAGEASLPTRPPADYWRVYQDDVCAELTLARRTLSGFKSWADYRAALDNALPYYSTYMFAVAAAKDVARIDGSLHDRLLTIVIPDQMLRSAVFWGQGEAADAPKLDPPALSILTTLLWRSIRDIDHRNTTWLKDVVSKSGWPTISAVGEGAAANAWLLIQHADDDPVYQYHVLQLMAPLVDKGEVNRRHYALLYDRVMLPLTGKQRYGTQFICDVKWHPQPLEDPQRLDELRKQAGLDPISEYAKQLIEDYGEHCRH